MSAPWQSTSRSAASSPSNTAGWSRSRRGSAASSRATPARSRSSGPAPMSIGEGEVAVIDPGPDLPEHVEALLDGLAGERVTHILITHTHRDHSPAAAAVQGGDRRADLRLRPACRRTARRARGRGRRRLGLRPRCRRARRRRDRRRGLALRGGAHARPHLEPSLLRAARQGILFSGRPCHGLVDQRHRAARRQHGRLYGLARQIAAVAATRSIGRPTGPRSPSRSVMSAPLSRIAASAKPASWTASPPASADRRDGRAALCRPRRQTCAARPAARCWRI